MLSKISFVTLILVVAVFTASSYASPTAPSLQSLSINNVRAMILERDNMGRPVYDLRNLTFLPDQVVFKLFEDEKWTSRHLFSIMEEQHLTCNTSHISDDPEQQPLGNFILEHVLELDFSFFKLPDTQYVFESLIKPILPCLTNLERLNLSGMKIGDNGAEYIANVKELKNLKHLNLDYTDIGDDGIIEIATKMNQLVSLSLQGNDGDKFSSKAATAIVETLPTLEYLNICYCPIGIQGAFEIASHLTHLRHLELGMNFGRVELLLFSDAEMTQKINVLVSFIASNMVDLVHLNIDCHGLKDENVVVIASNLGHLKYLSLYQNQLGPIGVNAIATELKELEFLDLSENPIGDEGAIAIAHHMKNLQELYLSNCGIGDQGAFAIARLNFKTMTDLVLNGNRIGDDGVKAIAANENVKSLNYLDLSFNIFVSKVVAMDIKEKLKNHIKHLAIRTF